MQAFNSGDSNTLIMLIFNKKKQFLTIKKMNKWK